METFYVDTHACVAALVIMQVNVLEEWSETLGRWLWGKKSPFYTVRVISPDFTPHTHVRDHKRTCACDSEQVDE